jgi:hypothetical protein
VLAAVPGRCEQNDADRGMHGYGSSSGLYVMQMRECTVVMITSADDHQPTCCFLCASGILCWERLGEEHVQLLVHL